MSPRYLLDTRLCRHIARHNPPAIRARFARHGSRELGISVVTWGELHCAAERSPSRDQSLATLARLGQLITLCPLPESAGAHYAQICAGLLPSGSARDTDLLSTNDLWVAAHARAEGWILVTCNEQAFPGIPGLQLENWDTAHA